MRDLPETQCMGKTLSQEENTGFHNNIDGVLLSRLWQLVRWPEELLGLHTSGLC